MVWGTEPQPFSRALVEFLLDVGDELVGEGVEVSVLGDILADEAVTVFDIAQLAPDGKIYIATGNGTDKLHVINNPDLPGTSCDIVQHGVQLPSYFQNSLPNHPNYHLGPVDGSVCDSLGINVVVPEAELEAAVHAYPNPSNGAFTLSYPAQATVGTLEVRDLSGKIILRERIPQWSTVHRIELHEAAGMYQCTVRWGVRAVSARVIIEP